MSKAFKGSPVVLECEEDLTPYKLLDCVIAWPLIPGANLFMGVDPKLSVLVGAASLLRGNTWT